ncbi:MAG: hypothetical protein AVDCRST_MAG68-2266, partial [uncultured Gemmatimonadetes bacterium]
GPDSPDRDHPAGAGAAGCRRCVRRPQECRVDPAGHRGDRDRLADHYRASAGL